MDQDDDDGGEVSRKKQGNQDDPPIGDIESLTLAELNRWRITEENWNMAEEVREQHIEGETFRKAREDKHRERGQVRQQDTVEQMKEVIMWNRTRLLSPKLHLLLYCCLARSLRSDFLLPPCRQKQR